MDIKHHHVFYELLHFNSKTLNKQLIFQVLLQSEYNVLNTTHTYFRSQSMKLCTLNRNEYYRKTDINTDTSMYWRPRRWSGFKIFLCIYIQCDKLVIDSEWTDLIIMHIFSKLN